MMSYVPDGDNVKFSLAVTVAEANRKAVTAGHNENQRARAVWFAALALSNQLSLCACLSRILSLHLYLSALMQSYLFQ